MTRTGWAALALPLLLATGLSGCAKPEPAKPAVDAAKISETVKSDASQLVAELNAKALDKAVAHDGASFVGMFHGAPNVTSQAEDKAQTAEQLKDPAFHLEIGAPTVEVAQAGDMALYRTTYKATMSDLKTGKQVTETGNWLIVYKPQPDGSWKIALNMVADTPPAAPAAAAPATPPSK